MVISDFQSSGGELADCVAVITQQPLALCGTPDSPLFPEQNSDVSDSRVKALQTEVELLRSINASLYNFTVDKVIKENSHLDKVSKAETFTVPQTSRRRKRKKSAASFDSDVLNVVTPVGKSNHNVVTPVEESNGLPKRKRKRKKKKGKTLASNSNELGH